jgi:hypothetical protein
LRGRQDFDVRRLDQRIRIIRLQFHGPKETSVRASQIGQLHRSQTKPVIGLPVQRVRIGRDRTPVHDGCFFEFFSLKEFVAELDVAHGSPVRIRAASSQKK